MTSFYVSSNCSRFQDVAVPGWLSHILERGHMGFLRKLFSGKDKTTKRVRICVECGMPVAEHKSWCSIYRTQQEMEQKSAKRLEA